MGGLVVFDGDVLVRRHDSFSLPAGKRTIGQQWIASIWHGNTLMNGINRKAMLPKEHGLMTGFIAGVLSAADFFP